MNKELKDRTLQVKWKATRKMKGFEDLWNGDEDGNLGSFDLELTHLSQSKIVFERPSALNLIDESLEPVKIKVSNFLDDSPSKTSTSKKQVLFEDNILFFYSDLPLPENLRVAKLVEGVFLLMNESGKPACLIITSILTSFTFNKINFDQISGADRLRFLSLYFRIYTHEYTEDSEIERLIKDLEHFLKNTKLNPSCESFLIQRIDLLKEDLEE